MPFTLQDINPVDAKLCLGVERFITKELGLSLAKQRLVLAVSGGADSLALLHIMRVLRPRLKMELHALVADHALRPQSGAEAEGVEPDARKYKCQACGELQVYGAEELLLEMY